MIAAFAKTAIHMDTKLSETSNVVDCFESTMNSSLARALCLKDPSPEKLDRPTSLAFLAGITKTSENNPFRRAVLKELQPEPSRITQAPVFAPQVANASKVDHAQQ